LPDRGAKVSNFSVREGKLKKLALTEVARKTLLKKFCSCFPRPISPKIFAYYACRA